MTVAIYQQTPQGNLKIGADGERIPFEVEKKESFMKLGWGLANAVPDTASAAFGARWIFPCDQLPDRVATFGFETPEGQLLKDWLNGKPSGTGAIHKARNRARQLKLEGRIRPDSNLQVTLFEDGTGIFVGNPSGSYGYLHVAAWIKPAAVVAGEDEDDEDYRTGPPCCHFHNYGGDLREPCGGEQADSDPRDLDQMAKDGEI